MAKEDKRTPSVAELDLQARLDPEHTPDANIARTVTVNPNPFGKDDYVGTDPIYQGRANKQDQPKAAGTGVEKQAEELFAEQYSLDDVDEDRLVDDYGFGGKAVKAGPTSRDVADVLIGGSADVTHKSDPEPAPAETPTQTDGGKEDGSSQSPANPMPPQAPPAPSDDENK